MSDLDPGWAQVRERILATDMKRLIQIETNLIECQGQLKFLECKNGFSMDYTWHTLQAAKTEIQILMDELYDRSNTVSDEWKVWRKSIGRSALK